MLKLHHVAAFALAVSCQPSQIGSRYVKSSNVGPAGASIEVTDADSHVLAGTRLEVGQGAIANDTTLTLELGVTDLVAHGAAGPVAVWEPSGLEFLQPVKMT